MSRTNSSDESFSPLYEDYAEIVDEEADYSSPSRDFELNRDCVHLSEILGQGQFGDVYGGHYSSSDCSSIIPVAVKTCKLEADESTAEKILEEALIMKQFDHQHIIKLIGICSDRPVMIIMELAKHGELRSYLKFHEDSLEVHTLVLFSYQLSTALSYLESKKFVHRDIAARNVLVSSHDCVKLADFGLSRQVATCFL